MTPSPRHHRPCAALESLEPRTLLSFCPKLPELAPTGGAEAAFFAGVHAAFVQSTIAVTQDFPLASTLTFARVEVDHGKIIDLASPNGPTLRPLNARTGYTLIPHIDWGDGTQGTSGVHAQAVTAAAVEFQGEHLYAQPGRYTITCELVAVPQAPRGARRLLGTGRQAVDLLSSQPPAPEAQLYHPTATVNATQELHLLTLERYYPAHVEADYGAALQIDITWGDGTTTAGREDGNISGDREIFGTHRFPAAGTYPLTINLWRTSPTLGRTRYQTLVTSVTARPMPEPTLHGQVAEPLAGVVGAIPRPEIFAPTAIPVTYRTSPREDVLSVTIDWGDGQVSAGSLRSNAADGYDVLGAHTFAAARTYRIKIDVIRSLHAGGAHHTNPYEGSIAQTLFATAMIGHGPTWTSFQKLPTRP